MSTIKVKMIDEVEPLGYFICEMRIVIINGIEYFEEVNYDYNKEGACERLTLKEVKETWEIIN